MELSKYSVTFPASEKRDLEVRAGQTMSGGSRSASVSGGKVVRF